MHPAATVGDRKSESLSFRGRFFVSCGGYGIGGWEVLSDDEGKASESRGTRTYGTDECREDFPAEWKLVRSGNYIRKAAAGNEEPGIEAVP